MSNEIFTEEVEETVVKKPSIFGMIMNPAEQFERIRENPKIIVPLLIVTVLTTVGMLLMLGNVDLTGEELAGMSEEEMMMITLIGQISFVAVGVFTPVFAVLISTVIFIIIAKIAQSKVTFKQLFSMNTFIFMITALSFIINGLAFMAVGSGDPEVLFTSLNSVIGAEGVLGTFLSTIEVFTIWGMILTALGLQVVARFSKVLSWSIVIGFYVVTTVFSMAATGLATMFGM